MKIMVLGGVGWIGSTLTKILGEHPEVDEVVIGDVDEAKSKKLIEEIGTGKVSYRKVDVYDHESLVKAMKGMDSVANALWYEFAVRVTKAAIDARIPLTDLGGMPELTKQQLNYDEQAKKAGILNIIGCGETPGISNVLARWGADRMESIDSIHIRDGEWGKDSLEWLQYSVRTSMDEMTEPSIIYKDGEYVELPPRSGRELYTFPDPIGEQECFTVPFEEAVTFPKYLGKPVNLVEMKVTVSKLLMDNFDILEQFGVTSPEPVTTRAGVTVPPVDVLIACILKMKIPPRKERTHSCIAIEMKGSLNGEKIQRSVYGLMQDWKGKEGKWKVDAEGYKTALPCALSAVMLAKGEIAHKGVLPPEACLDPVPFLEDLKKWGLMVGDSVKKI
jgi:saccharopine dehydrogenase-like NADP-dependent oxidoreductase